MIYVMMIVSCLNGDCRTDELHPKDNMTVFECMMSTQIVAAEWQKMHPNRKIKKIICKPLEA